MTLGQSGKQRGRLARLCLATLGLLALAVGGWDGGAKAWAQSKKPAVAGPQEQESAAGNRESQSNETGVPGAPRYMLVTAGDEILRVDKVTGQVSFCRKTNSAWRCVPAPDAERAYIEEIEALTGEVDRLQAELDAAEEKLAAAAANPVPEAEDVARAPAPAIQPGTPKGDPKISQKDEAELERMLDITESAMRRFFGLMNELKQDFEGDKG